MLPFDGQNPKMQTESNVAYNVFGSNQFNPSPPGVFLGAPVEQVFNSAQLSS